MPSGFFSRLHHDLQRSQRVDPVLIAPPRRANLNHVGAGGAVLASIGSKVKVKFYVSKIKSAAR